jgi:hypothetical protein
MYSAPASFLALPIESVFRVIKNTDFRKRGLSPDVQIKNLTHQQLSRKQYLLAQVAHFIFTISQKRMNNIYHERLTKLQVFLAGMRI